MRVIEASIPAPPSYPGFVKERVPAELKFHARLIVLHNTFKTAERRFAENGGANR